LKVSVSRTSGEESLDFECATDGETVEVRHVTYENQEGEMEPERRYAGPNYDDLDDTAGGLMRISTPPTFNAPLRKASI